MTPFKRKFLLILSFIRYLPRILLRYSKFFIHKKKLECTVFKVSNSYCIENTLNQLIWEIRHSVFVVLSNSSKIYFDTGDFIFKAKFNETDFYLDAYGFGSMKRLTTKIDIIKLQQHNFDELKLESKRVSLHTQKNSKTLKNRLQVLKNQNLNFLNSPSPKNFNNTNIQLKKIEPKSKHLFAIPFTKNIEEINQLKKVFETDIINNN